ncbi:hypothetical protein N752_06915 [Desulforamulus aquiferis]|nr:hypothetical protein N752_06915 [Desulforamulus aquiferis]
MNMTNFEQVALFEQRFWLQIMGDHVRFIFDTLAPSETEEIRKAQYFITTFDQLLHQARQPLGSQQIIALSQQAQQQTQELRVFKLDLIRQHLVGDIVIGLPPTFINHMVNELDEYLRVLGFLVAGQIPPIQHPVQLHLTWLLDAAGHASAIAGDVDMVEKKVMEDSLVFTEHFEQFYIKATEMAGYMRTGLKEFPASADLIDKWNWKYYYLWAS